MADEVEITKADLGSAVAEFGITDDDLRLFAEDEETVLVKAFVDGAFVKPTKKTDSSLNVELPPGVRDETSRIVVTTKDNKILNVLHYDGSKAIAIKDPPDDDSTLRDIAAAVQRIADGIDRLPPAAPLPAAAPPPGAVAPLAPAPPLPRTRWQAGGEDSDKRAPD
jgi:hypothetical protein